ncbi:glutathione peroxidase [Endozoicomonas sp. SM1973]|uniref:Glutathione peroxidase n=1 Tax=Spartinivicinus marinus TaxID=2994442 RepID=A0A853I3L4_9GAMM|nr:glutathione peroxidase [Spartinivicinus marinus]MCX4029982.1 glutathione peroxidase [Spartinivicinus marinus]NYZ64774.1 glutathione peroxidase [Spartinivicinus marinus]
MDGIYQIACQTIDGKSVMLADYANKVMLVVNTASQCMFTPQYQQLEQLFQQYQHQGLVVLGFPCNQFRQQEPDNESDIQQFCTTRYGVSFPLFAKINVNGDEAHPLFQLLKQKAPGLLGSRAIKWNFTKFLVSPQAKHIKRYSPQTLPEAIESDIKKYLAMQNSQAA